jgi:hypothetical protein
MLMLEGHLAGAAWSVAGTAGAAQAAGPLLLADGSLIGPELFQAAGEISAGGQARTAVLAANRLIWGVIVVLLICSVLAWAGGPQVADFLAGH